MLGGDLRDSCDSEMIVKMNGGHFRNSLAAPIGLQTELLNPSHDPAPDGALPLRLRAAAFADLPATSNG